MQTTSKATKGSARLIALLTACVTLVIATLVVASSSHQVEPLDSLVVPRTGHAATALSDGKIMITGGRDHDGNLIAAAEIFDPETQTSTASATLSTARVDHTATVLTDGRVLVAGGTGNSGPLTSAEIFDPAHPENGFQAVTSPMTAARTHHTATLLTNGTVLIAGGDAAGTAEIFEPTTQSFTPTLLGTMSRAAQRPYRHLVYRRQRLARRRRHRFAGAVHTRSNQTFTLDQATMSFVRTGHWAFELSDTRLLLFQGDTGNTIDEFNPTTDTLAPKASLDFPCVQLLALWRMEKCSCWAPVWLVFTIRMPFLRPLISPRSMKRRVPGSSILPRSGQSATSSFPGDKKILVAGGVNAPKPVPGRGSSLTRSRIWTDRDDYHPGDPVIFKWLRLEGQMKTFTFTPSTTRPKRWTYGSTETAGRHRRRLRR